MRGFRLSTAEQLLRETARGLAEKVDWDTQPHDQYPYAFAQALASHGLTGIAVDEADGGQGAGLVEALVVIEGATMVHPRAGDVVQATNFGAIRQIAELGDASTKERYLRPVLNGLAVTSVAISEAGSGSAVGEMRTRAKIEGGDVVVDGTKIFNTHGPYADHYVVWARFGAAADEIGAVIVPADAPGFSRGATEHYLGGEPHCALYFDACRIASANVLTNAGGLRRLLPIFNIERLGNAARSLACGERAFGDAVRHLRERRQFGRRLADFQGLRWRMADLRVRLDAARLLLYRAAASAEEGSPDAAECAIAKVACNEIGFDSVNAAIQTLGAMGLSDETNLPYLFGRTRGWMIAGGSVEMMRNRIADTVIGREERG